MDERLKRLNNFASGIIDMQLTRNPLASEVIVIFNDTELDQYQDSRTVELCRVKKLATVIKNPDMNYVQELGDFLLEDDVDKIPWIVSMTTSNLPRLPRMNDRILIDGILYTISVTKPSNRKLDSLLECIIYPERNEYNDPLCIYNACVKAVRGKWIVDIVYGGNPKYLSFNGMEWFSFASKVLLPSWYIKKFVGGGTLAGKSEYVVHRTYESGDARQKVNSVVDGGGACCDRIYKVCGGGAIQELPRCDFIGGTDAEGITNPEYSGGGAYEEYTPCKVIILDEQENQYEINL